MALQVWLPLNGNLNNKGLGNVTNNVTTGVINNSGKFGKCYACKSGAYLSFNYTLETTNDFSLAFWVKVPSTITTAAAWQTMLSFSSNNGSDNTTPINWANYNQMKIYDISTHQHAWLTIEYDTWLHFVITNRFSGGTNYTQIFKNGVLLGTYSSTTELKIRSGLLALGSGINATYGPIYYNDVRIYTTCLNNVDAQELYWGKIYELTPQWKHSGELSVLGDASGVGPLTRQTIGNVSLSGNTLYFNGTTGSTIKFDGFGAVGGALSIWYRYESTISGNQVLFLDPVNKMTLGYNGSGAFIVSTVTQARYSATGATANKWNHVVVNYGTDGKATGCWVNGVTPATASTEYWSTAGTIACVGARAKSATIDAPFKGYINEIKVFQSQLTANDVQYLYKRGLMDNNWMPDEPVWLRVLHHNNPKGARFTSQEDGKNKDTADQFSKLKIFFNNDDFRRADGNYEFMVKEKLESGSTEQTYRWSQTSNPTASTVTGYKLISQTNDPGRSFGLKNNGSYAVFHNGSTWWCACGSWSVFNEGIPGFGGTVLTGYLDLYVRADKVTLPAGYTELQYVQSDGTAYINAIVNGFNTADWEIYCKWMVTGWGTSYGYIFGAYSSENETSYRVILQNTDNDGYYVSSNCKAGSSIGVTNKAKNVIHTATLRDKSFDFDGVTYSAPTTGTAISTASTLCIFGRGSGTQNSKARVYELYGKKGGIHAFNLKPAKRDSDNAIGFYDLVNNRFVTKTGNGTLTGE